MFLVKARSQRVDFALYFLAVACFSTESRRPLQVNAHVFSFDRKKNSLIIIPLMAAFVRADKLLQMYLFFPL